MAKAGLLFLVSLASSIPGLRLPVTADPELFAEALHIGRKVIWLHTFGERFVDEAADRPAGPPRAGAERRPRVVATIPDTEADMPGAIGYDVAAGELRVGAGRIAPVSEAMWEYEFSGYKVVRRWFNKRKRNPEGRTSSPLDKIVARAWAPQWTTELLEILNVLALLLEHEQPQRDLLDRIAAGPLLTAEDLRSDDPGLLQELLKPERKSPQAQL